MAPLYGRTNTAISGQIAIMGYHTEGLIDTGASVSCVSHALWKARQAQWGPLQPLPTAVLGADGAPLNISGVTRPLPVTWGNRQTSATFVVIKGLARPQVILGMDLMPEFQVLIDTQLREACPKDDPMLANPATVHQLQKIPPGSVLHV